MSEMSVAPVTSKPEDSNLYPLGVTPAARTAASSSVEPISTVISAVGVVSPHVAVTSRPSEP